MLQKLTIKNYAIIDHLVFEPDNKLNIVTGETGAGKSIILGALSLILGERADTSVLINKDEKSIVEGYFDVTHIANFKNALEESELDYENTCIIRREIAISGKTRAFVNDTPVTLQVLNKLVSLLVDLHRQFGYMALEENDFPVDVLDAIGNNATATNNYRKLYSKHKKLSLQLNELKEKRALWQKEADYKQYLFDELQQAGFKDNEIEQAEQLLKQINNAERIKGILMASKATLEDGENPIVNELKQIGKQLGSITDVMPGLQNLQQRIESAMEELKDIVSELGTEEGRLSSDPMLMQEMQQRIDLGYKLLKKHSVNTTSELIEIRQKLECELKATSDMNETIEKLAIEESQVYKNLLKEGEMLSKQRQKIIPVFTEKMNKLLGLVGMPNARFKVNLEKTEPTPTGSDEVQFLFDANKSGQFQLLQKTASGGEMSRIMLCIKSLTANALQMPTLIFDEVDAGISGEAARQVAILLRDLSQYHQVICITHQPQVAAKGSRHYYVYKEAERSGRLTTKIKILPPEDRVLTIARMIGGEQPSEAAINNARELMEV